VSPQWRTPTPQSYRPWKEGINQYFSFLLPIFSYLFDFPNWLIRSFSEGMRMHLVMRCFYVSLLNEVNIAISVSNASVDDDFTWRAVDFLNYRETFFYQIRTEVFPEYFTLLQDDLIWLYKQLFLEIIWQLPDNFLLFFQTLIYLLLPVIPARFQKQFTFFKISLSFINYLSNATLSIRRCSSSSWNWCLSSSCNSQWRNAFIGWSSLHWKNLRKSHQSNLL